MQFVITNLSQLHTLGHKIGEAIADVSLDKPYVVTVKQVKKDRSLAQNKLAFQWYAELGKQSGNGKEFERNFCKWTYGMPILMQRDDEKIHEFYMTLIDNLTYEQRVAAMEYTDVTRMFKVKEFTEYLQSMERYAGDMGYYLSRPEDAYDEAMGRYRL